MVQTINIADSVEWQVFHIENYVDIDVQTQPCGFDLTMKSVHKFISPGTIDFDNSEREISETEIMYFKDNDTIFLEPGAYKIVFNEVVKIPLWATGLAYPRSSLLRCGVVATGAVWDSGYKGQGEATITVGNKNGFVVKRNARLMQLILILNSRPVDKENAYDGEYQEKD